MASLAFTQINSASRYFLAQLACKILSSFYVMYSPCAARQSHVTICQCSRHVCKGNRRYYNIEDNTSISLISKLLRGMVNDFSLFDCLSPFYFLLIELRCNFSISYKILCILYLLLIYFYIQIR